MISRGIIFAVCVLPTLAVAQQPAPSVPPDVMIFPEQTLRDLQLLGQGTFANSDVVYGFEQPLNASVYSATRDYFDPTSVEARLRGERSLQTLATDQPIANTILGAGVVSSVDVPGNFDLDVILRNGAVGGDWLSQQAVNASLIKGNLLQPDVLMGLEDSFLSGERPEAGAALATSYQFGFDGEVDYLKAGQLWAQAVEQTPNDLNFYSYANFLRSQGQYAEAAQMYAKAANFAPAIAGAFDLAWEQDDEPGLQTLLPSLLYLAQTDGEAALGAGDYYRSLARSSEGADRLSNLSKALEFYELALTVQATRKIFAARGMSRKAELYVEFPEIAPETWQQDIRALFNKAAEMGDAGGFLGLAKIALHWEDLKNAYALASRAAELGNPEQVEEARGILRAVCRPGAWDITCAPVPVFFVTTRKVDPSDPQKFGGADSAKRSPTYGLAFASIPLLSQNYPARQKLYEAAKNAVANQFGQAGLDRLAVNTELTVFTFETGELWGDMAKSVAEAAELDDAFAFVHGYNVAFDAALRTAAETIERADFPSLPVALSWPSEGEFLAYGQDVGRAHMACPRLFEGLKQLGRQFGGERLTLMAHSMGSLVVYSMISGCDQAPESQWRYSPVANLIYAAPDMPRFSFEEGIEYQTREKASHTTLYVTANDSALALSASNAVNDEIRAGQIPPEGPIVADRLMTIDATEAEAQLIDAVATGNINHGYVFTQPQVVADLGQLLNLEFAPDNRQCLRAAGRSPDYWLIRGDCAVP